MLPKNKLRERRLERLRIFPGRHMGILQANILKSWEDGNKGLENITAERHAELKV